MYNYRICLFLIIPISLHSNFESLQELYNQSKRLHEYPQKYNTDYLQPKYYSNTTMCNDSIIDKILQSLGLKKENPFAKDFLDLLEIVTRLRTKNLPTQDYAFYITPHENSKFFIWGDLQGAYHSLLRSLMNLAKEGILSDDFTIQSDNHYFIFNGDVIDRSAYDLETLSLLLILLYKNPHHAFYIQGNHERKSFWKNHSLQDAISHRLQCNSRDTTRSLEDQFDLFFKTLPIAIFLRTHNKKEIKLVQISHFDLQSNEIAIDHDQVNLQIKNTKSGIIKLSDVAQNNKNKFCSKSVEAIIEGVSRSTTYIPTDGLNQIFSDQGAVAWTILSSPTMTYQKLYNFYNDTYVVLETAKKLHDWQISLYKQHVHKKSGFDYKTYNFLYGQTINTTTTQTSSDHVFTFASTIDLSKSSIALGQRLQTGLGLCFNNQNSKGGVQGYRLKQILYDDGYTPSLTSKSINCFLKNFQSKVVITPLGTPTTKTLIPLVKNNEITVLFPYTGAKIFRNQDLTHFVHYRTSYDNEAKALIRYALDDLKKKKFAFFYQDDSYGLAPLKASREFLTKEGIDSWVEAPYAANTINIDLALDKIKKFNPDVIIFYSTVPPSAELCRKLGVEYLNSKTLMGISFLTDSFRYILNNKGLNFIISRVVPDYRRGDVKIVKEYNDVSEKYGYFKSADGLEAFINGKLLIHALMHIPPSNFDRQSALIQFFENLKNINFEGLQLNFDPQTRELSKNVWIDSETENWKYYDISDL